MTKLVGVVAALAASVAATATPAVAGAGFPAHSCWVRLPNPGYGPIRPIRSAPSVLAPAPRRPVDPASLLQSTLRRFGDRTIIRSARLGQLPAVVRLHRRGWFGPAPQPRHPRATAVAKAFRARVASLRFLHPLQQAPVIVFEAMNELAFIRFAKLEQQLGLRDGDLQRYEGYFIEAVDKSHVPFMVVWGVARGELGGGQWSSDHCHFPFATDNPRSDAGCNG
jgi:hypothetical protein